MTEIPLRLSNEDKELLLVSNLPTTVSAVVQAPQDIMANLSAQSFRATADLSGLSADVHRVPVDVRANDERVRVVSVDPTAIDVELQLKATQPMTVEVVVSDRDTLPFSYEINGDPSAQPSQVTVTGPADVMENLARTEVVIPLRGARSTVQEDRTVLFKDAQGQALTGLTADPETVQVTVPISQSFNTRDAAVHVVITGTVAPGYWISNIAVDPNTVTLLGPQAILEQIGGFVDTIPVDVSDAAGDILRRVPLAPPARVSALNQRGVSEASVETRITIVPQLGNLRLTVPVELNGAQPTDTVSKSPASVDVLLSGPLPVLNQVNADPKLVRVVVDVKDLASGTYDLDSGSHCAGVAQGDRGTRHGANSSGPSRDDRYPRANCHPPAPVSDRGPRLDTVTCVFLSTLRLCRPVTVSVVSVPTLASCCERCWPWIETLSIG